MSPLQENLVINNRPWWERYQPISYLWTTRSGTKEEFVNMVARCNKAGVRIYVDAILNHMSGNWNNAHGTGNSRADCHRAQCLSPTQVAPGHVSEILTMNTEWVKPENPELKK